MLLAADIELPGTLPAHPVVVHRDCLDAFHDANPTRWMVWGTLREFLQQISLATNVDDILEEREARKKPKKKAREGFAA